MRSQSGSSRINNHDDTTGTTKNSFDRIIGSAGSTGLHSKQEAGGKEVFHPVHPANPVIRSNSARRDVVVQRIADSFSS
jgi:hypothetical protein